MSWLAITYVCIRHVVPEELDSYKKSNPVPMGTNSIKKHHHCSGHGRLASLKLLWSFPIFSCLCCSSCLLVMHADPCHLRPGGLKERLVGWVTSAPSPVNLIVLLPSALVDLQILLDHRNSFSLGIGKRIWGSVSPSTGADLSVWAGPIISLCVGSPGCNWQPITN